MQFEDKQLKVKNLKIPRYGNERYSVEKKIEVVTQMLAIGNMRHVAAMTGVPWATIRYWRAQEWWKELEAEIKASRRAVTNTKLSKIVDKALEAVADRVENGNYIYDQKNETLVRRPVSALEATKVANDLMQRQRDLEQISLAEVQYQQTQTIQEQLKLLADEFSKFNQSRTINVKAMEVTDAVYEEREEGLQEGSGPLYLETGGSEEEDGTEQSPPGDGEGWEST